jgi:hypothetical protein
MVDIARFTERRKSFPVNKMECLTAADVRKMQAERTTDISKKTLTTLVDYVDRRIRLAIVHRQTKVEYIVPPFIVDVAAYDRKTMLLALGTHFSRQLFRCKIDYNDFSLHLEWSEEKKKPPQTPTPELPRPVQSIISTRPINNQDSRTSIHHIRMGTGDYDEDYVVKKR